ncbi:hypothetical protein BH20ACI2_BH20ACI2_12440 [soil metagenome]
MYNYRRTNQQKCKVISGRVTLYDNVLHIHEKMSATGQRSATSTPTDSYGIFLSQRGTKQGPRGVAENYFVESAGATVEGPPTT